MANRKMYSFKLDEELIDWFRSEAQSDNRSLSNLIETTLLEAKQKSEREKSINDVEASK